MHKLTIEVEDEVVAGAGMSLDAFAAEAKRLLAAKLYEMGRLTSGQAARMSGVSRVDFLLELPRFGIAPSNLTEEDLKDDVDFARHG